MRKIVPLESKHSDSIAALHMQFLPTPFRGVAGQHLLTAYYGAVASGCGAVGYVAEDDNDILGYICGVWSPKELRRRLLVTQWQMLGLWGAVGVFYRPQLLFSFLGRLGSPTTTEKSVQSMEMGYELRPIVVKPEARGTDVASNLVKRLLVDAAGRGYEQMYLYVEVDNEVAQGFYRKMGFAVAGTQQQNNGVISFERAVRC